MLAALDLAHVRTLDSGDRWASVSWAMPDWFFLRARRPKRDGWFRFVGCCAGGPASLIERFALPKRRGLTRYKPR